MRLAELLRQGVLSIFRHRRTVLATTLSDIRGRYVGTGLGFIWTVLYPLLFLGLYSVIYTFVFQVRITGQSSFGYTLVIFAGLIPFIGMADALGNGVGSVVENKGLVKNTVFPIELIPVKAVLSSLVTMAVGLLLLLAMLFAQGIYWSTQLLVPVFIFLQIMFTIGLIWLLSAFNVFFPDVRQMVSIIILFLMLVSPIAYTIDMIPPELMKLMYPNPLFYLIMLYREALIFGKIPWDFLLIFGAISIVTYFCGYIVFMRLKVLFADYV